jgi:hypothetical protein
MRVCYQVLYQIPDLTFGPLLPVFFQHLLMLKPNQFVPLVISFSDSAIGIVLMTELAIQLSLPVTDCERTLVRHEK